MATYQIQKRFNIFVGETIEADSIEDALAKCRQAEISDFITFKARTEVINYEEVTGLGVYEDW